jgi:phosphate starvation-inducible protein PhoH
LFAPFGRETNEKELLYVRSIAESADKGLGSLPGDITDKFDPFLMPLYDKLDEIIFEGDTAYLETGWPCICGAYKFS